jgi:hypothetical protein
MRDALRVCGSQARSDLPPVINGSIDAEFSAFQTITERFTIQQFGDEMGGSLVGTDIVDGKNIRMTQRSSSLRFYLKTPQPVRVGGEGSGRILIATSWCRRVSRAL